jgi:hypothetical protein
VTLILEIEVADERKFSQTVFDPVLCDLPSRRKDEIVRQKVFLAECGAGGNCSRNLHGEKK